MKLFHRLLFLFLIVGLGACVAVPDNDNIRADYAGYNCSQLQAELQLVNARISDISDRQTQNVIVNGTMSMMGYDVGNGPDDGSRDLPVLNARQDILQHELIRKDCYRRP